PIFMYRFRPNRAPLHANIVIITATGSASLFSVARLAISPTRPCFALLHRIGHAFGSAPDLSAVFVCGFLVAPFHPRLVGSIPSFWQSHIAAAFASAASP